MMTVSDLLDTLHIVYRARRSLPRVILLSHALNYKRGGREGLAEVISIHSLFS